MTRSWAMSSLSLKNKNSFDFKPRIHLSMDDFSDFTALMKILRILSALWVIWR